MLNKEIENLLSCNNCKLSECVQCEISYTERNQIREYIEQLETEKQNLIDKLEKDIVNITKTLQDGKHWDDYSRCRLKAYRTKTKEILRIVKGEKE